MKKISEKIILDEREYVALYLTDDTIGYLDLVANRLDISEEEANKIFVHLVNYRFVKEYKKSGSYEITNLGKDHLIKIGKSLGFKGVIC